ncbi:hypothetical protein CLOSTHATH_06221 [Hungatella hathewayi DSM 13479]|uniref:Uncharacterized protein n=1 Tax=Hungatella hathewayi DSM 13479 TaxID=566550 RepID=D3ARG5_9FIRM|nr:hypothetical protein CLOSTHATH_06221 [Hungatella hathewayi DSM 13479]
MDAGAGIRRDIAFTGQSKTQALQCQHSSGYWITGGCFFVCFCP